MAGPRPAGPLRCCAWVPGAEDAAPEGAGLAEQLVHAACRACRAYLGQLEHEDVDAAEDAAKGLSDDEWRDLTQQYYALVR